MAAAVRGRGFAIMVRAVGVKRLTIALAFCALLALVPYAVYAQGKSVSTFVDSRDGKTYRQAVIGSQTWMAENLKFDAEGSRCYKNSDANCEKYGKLYSWTAATGVCPAGWHLPTMDEWMKLEDFVEGFERSDKNNQNRKTKAWVKLKSATGWEGKKGNGTDEYGFGALPGGWGMGKNNDFSLGKESDWWTAEESGKMNAHRWYFGAEEGGSYKTGGREVLKDNFLSVRCVRN